MPTSYQSTNRVSQYRDYGLSQDDFRRRIREEYNGVVVDHDEFAKREPGMLSDTWNALVHGASSEAAGFSRMFGFDKLTDYFQQVSENRLDNLSEQGRAAFENELQFDLSESPLSHWWLNAASAIGQFGTSIGAGGVVGAGARRGAMAIARRAGSGASGQTAAGVGGLMAGHASVGGSAATGQTIMEAEATYDQLSKEEKLQSPAFNQKMAMLRDLNPELEGEELFKLADAAIREQIAADIRTDPRILFANYGLSAVVDPIIGGTIGRTAGAGVLNKLTRSRDAGLAVRAGGGAVRTGAHFTKGASIGGPTEVFQDMELQRGVGRALEGVDPDADPEHVDMNRALVSGVLGGFAQGSIAAVTSRAPRDTSHIKDPKADAIRESNPGVAAQMDAMAQDQARHENDVAEVINSVQQEAMTERFEPVQQDPNAVTPDPVGVPLERVNQRVAQMRRTGEEGNTIYVTEQGQRVTHREAATLARAELARESLSNQSAATRQEDRVLPEPVPAELSNAVTDESVAEQNQPEQTVGQSQPGSEQQTSVMGEHLRTNLPEGVTVKRNGQPFVSRRTALSSLSARQAQADGAAVEAIEIPGGWGWQMASPPSVTTTSTQNQAPSEEGVSVSTVQENEQPATREKPKEPTNQNTTIDDFGEKIGGARKDVWSGLREAIDSTDVAAQPLSKTFPQPNYQQLKDEGVDTKALAAVAALRHAIPNKPRKRGVSRWAENTDRIRHLAAQLLDGTVKPERLLEYAHAQPGLRSIANALPVIAQADPSVMRQAAEFTIRESEGMYVDGEPFGRGFVVERNGRTVWDSVTKTLEEAQQNLRQKIKALESEPVTARASKKNASLNIYRSRSTGDFYIGWKGASKVIEIEKVDSLAEGRNRLESGREELERKLERLKRTPSMRKEENADRVGMVRAETDVTPELFAESFGFRGVEFGNWVGQRKRQNDLNQAYEALHDLADVLEVPPLALSLNGELGLAFGARGKGGIQPAAAHYERGKIAINLTKNEGTGSLAHEWFHALDNYLSRERGLPGDYISERPYTLVGDPTRKEVIKAFNGIMAQIKASGMMSRAVELDGRRSKRYWSTNPELGARAFEAYVIAKLQQRSWSNDYLANVVSEDAWNALDEGTFPYPTQSEQGAINEAFDNFFETIETRETPRGIKFFSKSNVRDKKPAKGIAAAQVRELGDDLLKKLSGAAGINIQVFDTQKQAERAWKMSLEGNLVKGAFDETTNTAYVVAENVASLDEARQTLAHEIIAHGGLKNVISESDYREFIDRLKSTRDKKSFEQQWQQIDRDYEGVSDDVKAEELFAQFVENQPESAVLRHWFNSIRNWLRSVLAKVGLVPADADVNAMRSMMESIVDGFKAQQSRVSESEVHADSVEQRMGESLMYNKDAAKRHVKRSDWKAFPDVIIHRKKLGDMDSHPDFEAAKGGDIEAALRLVHDLIDVEQLRALRNLIGNDQVTLVPVHAEESVSRNKIPRAMADYIGVVLDADVDTDIVQSSYAGRTAQDGFGRLSIQPAFDGAVELGRKYIVLDDTLTQGGTLTNLRGFIESNGGEVVAATTLTGKQYSAKLRLSDENLNKLRDAYDDTGLETWWQDEFGYGFDKLTESEARYLLNASDADKIRDRVLAARQPGGSSESTTDPGQNEPSSDLKFSRTEDTRTAEEKVGQRILDDTLSSKFKNSLETLKTKSFWNRMREGLFDGLHGIKEAEEAAGVTDPNKQGYVSARLASGIGDMLHALFNRGALEWRNGVVTTKEGTMGLMEAFSLLPEGKLNDWLAWMAGNRAERLMQYGKENNLTADDIAQLKAKAQGHEAVFERVRQEYNTINKATLELARESGLLNAEQIAAFDTEWYVPFFRETDSSELTDVMQQLTAPHTKRTGIVGQSAQIKELLGGKQSTRDLLTNIIQRQVSLIDAAIKNNAAREVAANLDGTQFMTKVTDAESSGEFTREELAKRQKVRIMEHGKPVHYLVHDAGLLRGLMQVHDAGSKALFNRMARSAKRFLTTGVTLSPDFIIRNFIRDAAHAWMVNKDGAKLGTDTWTGLQSSWGQTPEYWNLIAGGAAFQGGYIHGADPEAAQQQIRRHLREKGFTKSQIDSHMKTLVTTKDGLLKAFEKYRQMSDRLENSNRMTVYNRAKQAGKSERQALFEAKDLMDYSMKGNFQLMSTFIDMLPFFNARMQGLYKLGRASAAEGNDRVLKVLSRDLAFKGMKVAGFSLALAALNGDDERYKELPEWDKDAHWHFFFGDQHVRIPKPFELGIIFGTIPERMFNFSAGNQTAKDARESVAHAVWNTLALNPTPQLFMPIMEMMMNKSMFTGAPIESLADERKEIIDRYGENTSDTARLIGRLTAVLGLSPKQVEHLITGYSGTLGAYALMASDGLARLLTGREKASTPIADWPVVRTLYQGGKAQRNTMYQQRFFESLDAARRAYGSYQAALDEHDHGRAQKLYESRAKELSSRRQLERIQRQINDLNSRMRAIQRDPNLSSAEKRERLDVLQSRRNEIYRQAYVSMNLRDW